MAEPLTDNNLTDVLINYGLGRNDTTSFVGRIVAEVRRLRAAIAEHHGQKADDRCVEDDDRLYAAAGLPPCDRRVGDKVAMLENCRRFIDRRCESGGWPSYRELEAEIERLREQVAGHCERIAKQSELLSRKAERNPNRRPTGNENHKGTDVPRLYKLPDGSWVDLKRVICLQAVKAADPSAHLKVCFRKTEEGFVRVHFQTLEEAEACRDELAAAVNALGCKAVEPRCPV